MKIKAVGAYSAKQPLEPMESPGVNRDRMMSKSKSLTVALPFRSPPGPFRVGGDGLPLRPGHEIVGRVVAVGDQVEKYARAIWSVSAALSTVVNIAKSGRRVGKLL